MTVTGVVVFVAAGVETEVIVGAGGCAYTVVEALELALPVNPETGSVCFAVNVCFPSERVIVSDQPPPLPTSAVPSAVVPSYSVTVSPATPVPDTENVASVPTGRPVIVGAGGGA